MWVPETMTECAMGGESADVVSNHTRISAAHHIELIHAQLRPQPPFSAEAPASRARTWRDGDRRLQAFRTGCAQHGSSSLLECSAWTEAF
jgi:hypothetical protein